MESLEQTIPSVEETYGETMLDLTRARGYTKKLLENAKVVRFLNAHHAEILAEFEAIAVAKETVRIGWLERWFSHRLIADEKMASTIHQRFVSRLPSLEQETGEKLFVSGLAGPYRIFQRKNGHRHGIDDATTAWYALQNSPGLKSALDLGTGIGTVGLAVLWGLGEGAQLTCVEAQEISYQLLTENISGNGLAGCVRAIHGDIRDLNLAERFPLVTGSPPYFPVGTGSLPDDSQKAHARFELRGDVGDYARAAKRHITDDGLFVFCFPFQQKRRCIELVTREGFRIMTIRDVIPLESKPPLFSLYCASLSFSGVTREEEPLLVATADGKYTAEMIALQATRGFGPEGTNRIE